MICINKFNPFDIKSAFSNLSNLDVEEIHKLMKEHEKNRKFFLKNPISVEFLIGTGSDITAISLIDALRLGINI